MHKRRFKGFDYEAQNPKPPEEPKAAPKRKTPRKRSPAKAKK